MLDRKGLLEVEKLKKRVSNGDMSPLEIDVAIRDIVARHNVYVMGVNKAIAKDRLYFEVGKKRKEWGF